MFTTFQHKFAQISNLGISRHNKSSMSFTFLVSLILEEGEREGKQREVKMQGILSTREDIRIFKDFLALLKNYGTLSTSKDCMNMNPVCCMHLNGKIFINNRIHIKINRYGSTYTKKSENGTSL